MPSRYCKAIFTGKTGPATHRGKNLPCSWAAFREAYAITGRFLLSSRFSPWRKRCISASRQVSASVRSALNGCPRERALTALCGNTPQIVTEALYSLHEQNRFPARVLILTTQTGRDMCRLHLLLPSTTQQRRRILPVYPHNADFHRSAMLRMLTLIVHRV